MSEALLQPLLEAAGIRLNGSHPWDIRIHRREWFDRVLRQKNLGLGESYMEGWWDCPRIDEMIDRLLRAGLEQKVRGSPWLLMRALPSLLWNRQSTRRSRIIADRHYNLGNDLFLSFLDPWQQYSCAWFEATDDLCEAQIHKMELLCRKLDLRREDHLLDIGCGWGGFARYAASTRGCRVTGVNISKPQLEFAQEHSPGLPVQFIECDYRTLKGNYTKIVSVGMFEHVGSRNYHRFFKVVERILDPQGIFLLHTIGGNQSRHGGDPWFEKYIFPNGMIPSLTQIHEAAEGSFVCEDLHNLGPHYDRTLCCWEQRFEEAWPHLRSSYDETFRRMWKYYLLSSAGAFRARKLQLWQFVFIREGSGREQPPCRPAVMGSRIHDPVPAF